MRLVSKILSLALLVLSLANTTFAAETNESYLRKSDIENIKIFSNQQDRIHFFLTDHNKTKYRIKNLTQSDAEAILDHFKNDDLLVVQTHPNEKGYLDILTWKKASAGVFHP